MDEMPDFETPTAPVLTPPKKPKPKPTRKARKPQSLSDTINHGRPRRRKRRVARAKPVEQHAGGKYPPEIYRLIGTLMNLDLPLRNFVIEVTKGLSK